MPGVVDDDSVDASPVGPWSHHRSPTADRIGHRKHLHRPHPEREPQAAGRPEFEDAGGLEAELYEAGLDEERRVWPPVVRRQVGRQPTDDAIAVAPDGIEDAVRRAVEVDAVDLVGPGDRAGCLVGRGNDAGRCGTACETHPTGEVGGDLLGLVDQRPARDEAAVGHHVLTYEARSCRELEGAGFVAEELARREERHVLDRDDCPTQGCCGRHLGKALDAHHAGKHGCAVDPVVVEEALLHRGEEGLHRQAVGEGPSRHHTEHRSSRGADRGKCGGEVEPAVLVVLVVLGHEEAEAAGHDDLAARAGGGDLAPHDRNADLRRQHLDARHRHHLRDRAAARHPDAGPRRPVDGDPPRLRSCGAEARHGLAQQVVGRAVVGLATVPEASGDRAEDDRGRAPASPKPCRRLNHPSLLTSKTRSYSCSVLSSSVWLISSPAVWRRTSTRASFARTSRITASTASPSVRSTWCQCASPPARVIVVIPAHGHLLAAAREGLRAAPEQHLQ